jgi:hypothetical protein
VFQPFFITYIYLMRHTNFGIGTLILWCHTLSYTHNVALFCSFHGVPPNPVNGILLLLQCAILSCFLAQFPCDISLPNSRHTRKNRRFTDRIFDSCYALILGFDSLFSSKTARYSRKTVEILVYYTIWLTRETKNIRKWHIYCPIEATMDQCEYRLVSTSAILMWREVRVDLILYCNSVAKAGQKQHQTYSRVFVCIDISFYFGQRSSSHTDHVWLLWRRPKLDRAGILWGRSRTYSNGKSPDLRCVG